MIKYICDKGDIKLEIKGDIAEICSDVDMLISEIYIKMLNENPKNAETFKYCIKRAMRDEICFATSTDDDTSNLEMLILTAMLRDLAKDEDDIKFEKFSKKFSSFMKGDKTEEE